MERPEQYLILTDAWKCIKKYLNADLNDDEICTEIRRTFDDAYKKYESEFAKEIFVNCINEIERIWKEKANGRECRK